MAEELNTYLGNIGFFSISVCVGLNYYLDRHQRHVRRPLHALWQLQLWRQRPLWGQGQLRRQNRTQHERQVWQQVLVWWPRRV